MSLLLSKALTSPSCESRLRSSGNPERNKAKAAPAVSSLTSMCLHVRWGHIAWRPDMTWSPLVHHKHSKTWLLQEVAALGVAAETKTSRVWNPCATWEATQDGPQGQGRPTHRSQHPAALQSKPRPTHRVFMVATMPGIFFNQGNKPRPPHTSSNLWRGGHSSLPPRLPLQLTRPSCWPVPVKDRKSVWNRWRSFALNHPCCIRNASGSMEDAAMKIVWLLLLSSVSWVASSILTCPDRSGRGVTSLT